MLMSEGRKLLCVGRAQTNTVNFGRLPLKRSITLSHSVLKRRTKSRSTHTMGGEGFMFSGCRVRPSVFRRPCVNTYVTWHAVCF